MLQYQDETTNIATLPQTQTAQQDPWSGYKNLSAGDKAATANYAQTLPSSTPAGIHRYKTPGGKDVFLSIKKTNPRYCPIVRGTIYDMDIQVVPPQNRPTRPGSSRF